MAEICKQYLTKGQQVYVEGRLQTRRWEDSDGNQHTSTEIVANEMIILGERKEAFQNEDEVPSEEKDEFPF